MSSNLSPLELALVRRYLAGATSGREVRLGWARAASVVLAATGLAVAAYTTLLFLQHPTDRVAVFVLLPGGGAGLLLILAGLGILGYLTRATERARLAAILRKLLPGEMA